MYVLVLFCKAVLQLANNPLFPYAMFLILILKCFNNNIKFFENFVVHLTKKLSTVIELFEWDEKNCKQNSKDQAFAATIIVLHFIQSINLGSN